MYGVLYNDNVLSPAPPPQTQRHLVDEKRPILETSNILEHLSGSEYSLVVGEGTYSLRESIYLATPPPHPSEQPAQANNVLPTHISSPTVGTKLSLAIIAPKISAQQRHIRPESPTSVTSAPSSQEAGSHGEKQSSRSSNAESLPRANTGFGNVDEQGPAPVFGQSNPVLSQMNGKDSKDAAKKRKPKNSMVKTNSSFVSRVLPHDNFNRKLQDHSPDGMFIFANINRAFQWLDLSGSSKADFLTKILFTKAHALCHDINPITKTSNHLDLVIGFSTGDIFWYEPISQKYTRINKNGLINNTAVHGIKWMPNSENLFLAAHADGTLIVYDKEKEDAAYVPEEILDGSAFGSSSKRPTLQVRKSVQSKTQKTNPVACWKVSNQRINSFSFSPDGRHLAVVSEDGSLRVIDFHKEQLLHQFTSYYGGLICVCWSPDGRYILTGGQDDLVSIWSLADTMLVARCQGHSSWVTSVAFDPWRCDDRNYRFGSVGEDCQLLLWDFNVGMLHRPRAASVRQRASISSHAAVMRTNSESLTARLRSDSNLSNHSMEDEEVVHEVQPRAQTAVLPPVMEKVVDDHILSWLGFEEDGIITSCSEGHVRTWDRPKDGTSAAAGVGPPDLVGPLDR